MSARIELSGAGTCRISDGVRADSVQVSSTDAPSVVLVSSAFTHTPDPAFTAFRAGWNRPRPPARLVSTGVLRRRTAAVHVPRSGIHRRQCPPAGAVPVRRRPLRGSVGVVRRDAQSTGGSTRTWAVASRGRHRSRDSACAPACIATGSGGYPIPARPGEAGRAGSQWVHRRGQRAPHPRVLYYDDAACGGCVEDARGMGRSTTHRGCLVSRRTVYGRVSFRRYGSRGAAMRRGACRPENVIATGVHAAGALDGRAHRCIRPYPALHRGNEPIGECPCRDGECFRIYGYDQRRRGDTAWVCARGVLIAWHVPVIGETCGVVLRYDSPARGW